MTRTSPRGTLWVHDLLDEAAEARPDGVAVRTAGVELTYAEAAEQSRRVATAFAELGVGRGDRVLLLAPNSVPVVTSLMAASRLGAVFSVLSPETKPYHLRHILDDAEPTVVVTAAAREEEVAGPDRRVVSLEGWADVLGCPPLERRPPGITGDVACLIYTSGSTGRPKAVVSSHRSVVFAAEAIGSCLGMRETDVVGTFLPMSFDVGLYQLFLCCLARATLALGDERRVGAGLLSRMWSWGVTGLPAVPSLVAMLLRLARREGAELPPLRFVTNTGARLPRSSIEGLHELFPGCRVFVMYGLTECKRVAILPPEDWARKPDSVGLPLPDTECVVVGDEGEVLPPGAPGQLVVRGPHVMQGYWRAPELTAQRYRQWGPGTERALFTGDVCSIDEDGYLYFHGRFDDIYKQRGFRVSVLELEAAAGDVPGVAGAVLVPPDDAAGAILFVTGEVDAEAVMEGLRVRLEEYKLPERVLSLEEMPLMPNGKVDRRRLRELARERCDATS